MQIECLFLPNVLKYIISSQYFIGIAYEKVCEMKLGLLVGAVVKNLPANQCRRPKRCRYDPWVRKIFSNRKWKTISVFLLGKFHRQTVHVVAEFVTTENTCTYTHVKLNLIVSPGLD